MFLLVLFSLSVDVCIDVVYINRQNKITPIKHQQTDKTTQMKTSTDKPNNTNENINRETKQHWRCFVHLLMSVLVLLCLSVDVCIGVVLSIC
jgi:t-SNARE complex subunit (syntaxin)